MELHQLHCFLMVVQEGGISPAAKKLGISQPSLSKTIMRLEEDLGIPLFDRKSKKVILNEYGIAVLDHAQKIFSIIDNMHQNIEDIQKGNFGTVSIGSTLPSNETGWLLSCIRDFILENPNVVIKQHQMQPAALQQAILGNELDIAIGGMELTIPELEWFELYRQRLGIIVSDASDHLTKSSKISLSDLRNETFFCNNSNTNMELITMDMCEKAGFMPKIVLISNYSNLIGELISQGIGISIIPEPLYDQKLERQDPSWPHKLLKISLQEEYCCLRVIAACARNKYISNAAANLFNRIIRYAPSPSK